MRKRRTFFAIASCLAMAIAILLTGKRLAIRRWEYENRITVVITPKAPFTYLGDSIPIDVSVTNHQKYPIELEYDGGDIAVLKFTADPQKAINKRRNFSVISQGTLIDANHTAYFTPDAAHDFTPTVAGQLHVTYRGYFDFEKDEETKPTKREQKIAEGEFTIEIRKKPLTSRRTGLRAGPTRRLPLTPRRPPSTPKH